MQGRGGMGSHKHGTSGHATKSPKLRLATKMEAERTEKKAPPPREPWRNPKPLPNQPLRQMSTPPLPAARLPGEIPRRSVVEAAAPPAPPSEPKAEKKRATSAVLAGKTGLDRAQFRLDAVRRVLLDGKHGACARVARELGITSPSTVWQWVADWKEHYGAALPPLPGPPQLPEAAQSTTPEPAKTETLLSRPTPPSTPAPTAEPAPSVTLQPAPKANALEEALCAIIDARIDKAYRLQMRKLWQP